MKGASVELQEVSLVALLNDPYLLSKCVDEISEGFFNNPSYKLIYKCLKNYYARYMVVPSKKELAISIRDNYISDYGDMESIMKDLDSLLDQKVASQDYVYEKVVEFIRRNRIESSLSKVVKSMEGGEINLDEVAVDLRDSILLDISKSQFFNLADVANISKIREKALGCTGSPIIVKFFIEGVNNLMQYKGLIPGTLNMIIAPPGRGKTTMGICQGVSSAQQGYKVLHVFLGDMSEYDGLLRYTSSFSGVDTSRLVDMTDDQLAKFIQKYNMNGQFSNIDIISYAAGEKTATQLMEEILNRQKAMHSHYDVIIVDYDENIANDSGTDNMYESGGSLYNKLALLSVVNKSVVFIMSQPKISFWGGTGASEVIPLEGASESSKKQKIIDMMISLSKPSKSSEVGTMYIAKNRRGQDSKIFRLGITGSNCTMKHISEDEYNRIKNLETRNGNNN